MNAKKKCNNRFNSKKEKEKRFNLMSQLYLFKYLKLIDISDDDLLSILYAENEEDMERKMRISIPSLTTSYIEEIGERGKKLESELQLIFG